MITNPIIDQIGNDAKARISRLEEQRSRRVFFATIPCADDENEARGNGAFEESLQCAEDHQVCPVLGGGDADYADAPAEHVDGKGSAEGPALEEEVGGEFAAEVGNVEPRCNVQ